MGGRRGESWGRGPGLVLAGLRWDLAFYGECHGSPDASSGLTFILQGPVAPVGRVDRAGSGAAGLVRPE